MSPQAEIIVRHGGVYLLLVAGLCAIGKGVIHLLSAWSFPISVGLIGFLLLLTYVAVETFVREWKALELSRETGEHAQLFAPTDMPIEFRFINSDTKVVDILNRLGKYDRIRGRVPYKALQYDLPGNAAILIFPQDVNDGASCVRGVQFYANRDTIELFP